MKTAMDKIKKRNAAKAERITSAIAEKFREKEKEKSPKKIDLSKIAKEVAERREKILSTEKKESVTKL